MTNFDRFHIVDIRQFHIGLHYTQPIKLFASSAIQEQLELFLGAEFYCCMRLLTATCAFRTENDLEGLIKLFVFLFQVVLFRVLTTTVPCWASLLTVVDRPQYAPSREPDRAVSVGGDAEDGVDGAETGGVVERQPEVTQRLAKRPVLARQQVHRVERHRDGPTRSPSPCAHQTVFEGAWSASRGPF